MLKNKLSLDDIDQKRMELILQDIEKLEKIIKDTLFFSKPIELNIEKYNLNFLIEETSKKLTPLLNKHKIKLNLKLSEKLNDILIDKERFEFVLENLFYNSIDALANKKRKIIKIETKQKKNSQKLIFYDNGNGIKKEHISNIFKPFFTTKTKGMGLGLANVERIVKLHRGKIEAKSLHGKYCKITIELPC